MHYADGDWSILIGEINVDPPTNQFPEWILSLAIYQRGDKSRSYAQFIITEDDGLINVRFEYPGEIKDFAGNLWLDICQMFRGQLHQEELSRDTHLEGGTELTGTPKSSSDNFRSLNGKKFLKMNYPGIPYEEPLRIEKIVRALPKEIPPNTARQLISEIPGAWKKNRNDQDTKSWTSGYLANYCNRNSAYVSRILASLYKAGLKRVNGINLPYKPRKKVKPGPTKRQASSKRKK